MSASTSTRQNEEQGDTGCRGRTEEAAGRTRRDGISCRADATRETIESLAMALVLAMLLRGFAAEAFVIPTGSMAPTLMGRHKDVTCPQCGYQYQVGASDGADRIGRTDGEERDCRHVPDMPLHHGPGPCKHARAELPVVQRRPHRRQQVQLRIGRAAAMGRRRLPLPDELHPGLHQARCRAAERDVANSIRRRLGEAGWGAASSRSRENRRRKSWPRCSRCTTAITGRSYWSTRAGRRSGRPWKRSRGRMESARAI